MALGANGSYAETALTAILALLATEHGDDFDPDVATASLEPIINEIEVMFRAMIADAEVEFVSGNFSGADSNGDTPDTIAATEGTIS